MQITRTQKVFVKIGIKNLVKLQDCMFQAIHYCKLMYLRTINISALKYMNLILQNFLQLLQ